jgi:hypothetical protein
MDDSPLRNFYGEWCRLVRRCSHDIDADWTPPAETDARVPAAAAGR